MFPIEIRLSHTYIDDIKNAKSSHYYSAFCLELNEITYILIEPHKFAFQLPQNIRVTIKLLFNVIVWRMVEVGESSENS